MSGKRRFCCHCSEYVSKSTYFEHQKEVINKRSSNDQTGDDCLQWDDDRADVQCDLDSSSDEPVVCTNYHESFFGSSESEQEDSI